MSHINEIICIYLKYEVMVMICLFGWKKIVQKNKENEKKAENVRHFPSVNWRGNIVCGKC